MRVFPAKSKEEINVSFKHNFAIISGARRRKELQYKSNFYRKRVIATCTSQTVWCTKANNLWYVLLHSSSMWYLFTFYATEEDRAKEMDCIWPAQNKRNRKKRYNITSICKTWQIIIWLLHTHRKFPHVQIFLSFSSRHE